MGGFSDRRYKKIGINPPVNLSFILLSLLSY